MIETGFVPALATIEVEITYEVSDGRVAPYSASVLVDTHVAAVLTDAIADAATTANWSQVQNDNGGRPQDGATRNVNRGSWSSGTTYGQGDIVLYSGSSYSANGAVPAGTLPTNTAYWTLLIAGGVPGAPGANGISTYVHVAYANSADGSSGFVTGVANPGRTYIGIYTDTTSAGSGDYHAYNWSRLTGADGTDGANGVPGAPGANGLTPYVHFAYADASDGSSGFSFSPGSHRYVGIYTDFTSASSSSYTAYAWSLIKGADGATGGVGAPGANGTNGVDGLAALNIHTVGAVSWDGHNLLCTANAGNWNTNGAYSANVIPGGVALTFQRPDTFGSGESAFVGLCSSPTPSIDYAAIDAAWWMGNDGSYFATVWHAGAQLYREAWSSTNTYSIRYDSSTGYVIWYRTDASGTTTAVCTYNMGVGKSYGFMAAAYGSMSLTNVAFTAAGGTGATGAAGTPGPPGTAGVSPSPSYPAQSIAGAGTFQYASVIPLENGQTLTLEGDTYVSASYTSGGPANVTMQLQYSTNAGGSWSAMGSTASTGNLLDGDGADLDVVNTYTNSSGGKQVLTVRAVITKNAQAGTYFSNTGYLQPS